MAGMASWFDELDLGETSAAGMMTWKWLPQNSPWTSENEVEYTLTKNEI